MYPHKQLAPRRRFHSRSSSTVACDGKAEVDQSPANSESSDPDSFQRLMDEAMKDITPTPEAERQVFKNCDFPGKINLTNFNDLTREQIQAVVAHNLSLNPDPPKINDPDDWWTWETGWTPDSSPAQTSSSTAREALAINSAVMFPSLAGAENTGKPRSSDHAEQSAKSQVSQSNPQNGKKKTSRRKFQPIALHEVPTGKSVWSKTARPKNPQNPQLVEKTSAADIHMVKTVQPQSQSLASTAEPPNSKSVTKNTGRRKYEPLLPVDEPVIAEIELPENDFIYSIGQMNVYKFLVMSDPGNAFKRYSGHDSWHQLVMGFRREAAAILPKVNRVRQAETLQLFRQLETSNKPLAHHLALQYGVRPVLPDGTAIAIVDPASIEASAQTPAIPDNPTKTCTNQRAAGVKQNARTGPAKNKSTGPSTPRQTNIRNCTTPKQKLGQVVSRASAPSSLHESGDQPQSVTIDPSHVILHASDRSPADYSFEEWFKTAPRVSRRFTAGKRDTPDTFRFYGYCGNFVIGSLKDCIAALRKLEPYYRAHAIVNNLDGNPRKKVLAVVINSSFTYQNKSHDQDVIREVVLTHGIEDLSGTGDNFGCANTKIIHFPADLKVLADEVALRNHLATPFFTLPSMEEYNAKVYPKKKVNLSYDKFQKVMKAKNVADNEARQKQRLDLQDYMNSRALSASQAETKRKTTFLDLPPEIRNMVYVNLMPKNDRIQKAEIKPLTLAYWRPEHPKPRGMDAIQGEIAAGWGRNKDDLQGPGLTAFMYKKSVEYPKSSLSLSESKHRRLHFAERHGRLANRAELDIDDQDYEKYFHVSHFSLASVLRRKEIAEARKMQRESHLIGPKPRPHNGGPCDVPVACKTPKTNGDDCGCCESNACMKSDVCFDCMLPEGYAQGVYDVRIAKAGLAMHQAGLEEAYKSGRPIYPGLFALSMTCHQLHLEITPMIFDRFNFSFGSPDVVQMFIDNLTDVGKASVRRISLRSELDLSSSKKKLNEAWKSACELISRQCHNLTDLEYVVNVKNEKDFSHPEHTPVWGGFEYPTGFEFCALEKAPWGAALSKFTACKQLTHARIVVQPDKTYKCAVETRFPALTKALGCLLRWKFPAGFDHDVFAMSMPSLWFVQGAQDQELPKKSSKLVDI